MITESEQKFIQYWEQNRRRKKNLLWQLAAGLPLAAFLVGAILLNIYSDWFKGAASVLHANSELFLVVIIGVLLIVIFIIVFSARHRWEMNEQRYRELLAKGKNP